jgi:hypothetical protein
MERDPVLLPQPRRLERLGGSHTRSPGDVEPAVRVDPAAVTHPEGYHLAVLPERIEITAGGPAGAFYGRMTLRQLERQSGVVLPCLHIEDWPDFPHRGVMLDVSRDRVPTMESLFALIDLLAEWKLNQLQLYTEHTFAYRNHREVWEKASPLTAAEVQALDARCRERFIELVPNQNSFGHMDRWLKHPRYLPLAEAPQGFTDPWGKWRDGAFSLCPVDPRSLELLEELYAELLPNFSSRRFNVGCDETWDLGQGRSREACAARGKGRVYLDFLCGIHARVRRHDRALQFWGDVILNHPELIPELPEGVTALEWGYEADHPFAAEGEVFARAGVPFYVCPGTSTWNAIAGRTDNALANLRSAADAGLAHGATGYLITDWGDNGHWQPPPVSYLGYAWGAALAWAGEANQGLDLARALDAHAFWDEAGMMGALARDLGNAYRETGALARNASVLSQLLLAPEQPMTEGAFARLTPRALERTAGFIDQVMAVLPGARMARPDAALVAGEFRLAAALLGHACRLGIARLGAGDGAIAAIPAAARRALAAELDSLLADYRRLWLARSRPGGLDDSAGRLERLRAAYQQA